MLGEMPIPILLCHSLWLYTESDDTSKASVIQMVCNREILFTESHGHQVRLDEAVRVCQFYIHTLLLGPYFLLQGGSECVNREKKATWKIYCRIMCTM